MKLRTLVLFVLTTAIAVAAQTTPAAPSGQTKTTPTPNTQAQPQQPQQPPSISGVVDREVSSYERLIVGVAEAMPEDKYNFTPASLNIPGAAFKDVRTFAQLIKHTATANYFYWGAATGEKPPESIKGPNGPDELTSKAQIVQFLKDSFAVGHRAAKMITPENALEMVQFRTQNMPRLFAATNAVIHCGDEYGQMVEYLRMNGIVPPASAGQGR
jgi:hypothetical protein